MTINSFKLASKDILPGWTADAFVIDRGTSLDVQVALLDDAHGVVPDAVAKLARPEHNQYITHSIIQEMDDSMNECFVS